MVEWLKIMSNFQFMRKTNFQMPKRYIEKITNYKKSSLWKLKLHSKYNHVVEYFLEHFTKV